MVIYFHSDGICVPVSLPTVFDTCDSTMHVVYMPHHQLEFYSENILIVSAGPIVDTELIFGKSSLRLVDHIVHPLHKLTFPRR